MSMFNKGLKPEKKQRLKLAERSYADRGLSKKEAEKRVWEIVNWADDIRYF